MKNHKTIKKIVFIPLLLFLISGCSPKYIKIGPEYEKDSFKGKSVGVMVYKNKIFINYAGDVENEFGEGNTDDLIKRYFHTELPKHLQDSSIFSEAYFDSCHEQNDFKKIVVIPARPR